MDKNLYQILKKIISLFYNFNEDKLLEDQMAEFYVLPDSIFKHLDQ